MYADVANEQNPCDVTNGRLRDASSVLASLQLPMKDGPEDLGSFTDSCFIWGRICCCMRDLQSHWIPLNQDREEMQAAS